MTVFCICTFFKGSAFLEAAKEAGNRVYLLTDQKLAEKPWPWEAIDEVFYLDEVDNTFSTYQKLLDGVAHVMRDRKIDVVVALDDFDVEKAALVREHFRIPGMGQTTARYFRDKLAMRIQAQNHGLPVPPFSPLFTDIDITEYLQSTSAPWVIKPRSEASATGIRKVYSLEEAWEVIHSLGEHRHHFLIEQFKPGHVFHVDSLSQDGVQLFSRCSQYLSTPFEVAHGGGIFRSVTVQENSEEESALLDLNARVLQAFGLQLSASHTEIIQCHEDGQYYFLETASRVGGAHLAEMVEASSGINLWREWAKLETAHAHGTTYQLPEVKKQYSGILITLSSFEKPDYTPFHRPEVVWTMAEEYHVGLIVQSPDRARVLELMDDLAHQVHALGYHASAPAPDKPTH